MSDTKRLRHIFIRHANPLVDPETERSIDVLSAEGVNESIQFGTTLGDYCKDRNVQFYHSGANRAHQTAMNIATGIGKPGHFLEDRQISTIISLSGASFPSAIPYGPEFIEELLMLNKGWKGAFGEDNLIDYVGEKVRKHITNPWGVYNGNFDALSISVSHGPIVEIGYGNIMRIPDEEIPQLALEPLQGFEVLVDTKIRSESIDQTLIGIMTSYNGSEPKPIPKEYFLSGGLK